MADEIPSPDAVFAAPGDPEPISSALDWLRDPEVIRQSGMLARLGEALVHLNSIIRLNLPAVVTQLQAQRQDLQADVTRLLTEKQQFQLDIEQLLIRREAEVETQKQAGIAASKEAHRVEDDRLAQEHEVRTEALRVEINQMSEKRRELSEAQQRMVEENQRLEALNAALRAANAQHLATIEEAVHERP